MGKQIKNGKQKLEELQISHHKNLIEKYMGKFPTIYLDLKEVRSGNDFESMRNSLSQCIQEAYRIHSYLKTSTKLQKYDKKYFKSILDSEKIPNSKIPGSLENLSRLLSTHWKKRVYVFVDEYDSPTNYIYSNEDFKQSEIKDVICLFSSVFLNLLKSNAHIEKALLTGILPPTTGFLYEVNNILKINCEHPSFGKEFYWIYK